MVNDFVDREPEQLYHLIGSPAPYNPAPAIVGAKPRSTAWPKCRSNFLNTPGNGYCCVCRTNKLLNVHHKKPYHLFPDLELVFSNLITLCETPTHNCHFIVGHCLDWTAYNPKVIELATLLKVCLEGKLMA